MQAEVPVDLHDPARTPRVQVPLDVAELVEHRVDLRHVDSRKALQPEKSLHSELERLGRRGLQVTVTDHGTASTMTWQLTRDG
ncbi:hypothetical protein QRX50_37225 [Amycolatopsis carbonis]|uniref:Uncharacterized protein n=1 Tax=Amycolatopsis carbonis TaxID=715471 RepID=A0A9Y2IC38_9PSEU|nr:hypothetical protein [Amycolatopsis sp. 2-15]WIX77012.1 hypothetical protein QRX50_37225 [Amycolatopsis sp. 2-15]